jgi:hypothetical protein
VLELPKPPWYRRVWMLNLAIAVVVVAILVTATVALGSRRDRQANPTLVTGVAVATTQPAPVEPTQPSASVAPRTTAKTKPPGLLWEKSGSDGIHGGLFPVPDGSRLEWSFDCSSFARYGGGNFKLSGEGRLDGVSVQRFAVKDQGTVRVRNGGRGRLVIETVCDRWTVRAMAP